MACKDAAARTRRYCADWEVSLRGFCREWGTGWIRRCLEWGTRLEQRCDAWRTEWDQRCDRWETTWDQACDDWIFILKWICLGWSWVSTTFCRLWVWFSTTVCTAWVWVTVSVCLSIALVPATVCLAFTVIFVAICRLWVLFVDTWCSIWCWIKRLRAPAEFSESKSECIYGWTSAYRAEFDAKRCHLRIELRIRLDPDGDVSAAQVANGIASWEPAIEAAWSNQFALALQDGTCTCKEVTLEVDVQFVDDDEHHVVEVHSGSGRENMTNWYATTTGATAAHEAGHMLGNPDEYADTECDERTVTNDGSLMQTTAGSVKVRHYESFARWLSNRTCCTYKAA